VRTRGIFVPEARPAQIDQTVRVLLTAEQIQARVRELGLQLARDYQDRRPVLVAVLKGAVVFLSDLVRATPIDLEIDFMSLSSYGASTHASGPAKLVHDLRTPIAGRDVVLVEGVADTGHSISFILDTLRARQPSSLKVCALLDKAPCRRVPVSVDYCGFTIGDEFVVGYGLDVAERYRNLPYVGVVDRDRD
jgi:hypoxanthine phosphoribosyltransferase